MAPVTDGKWPVWKLSLMLYPFAATAVAINLFMLALLWTWVGLPAITPVAAVIWCLPLGVPAAWGLGRWARRLMDEADD